MQLRYRGNYYTSESTAVSHDSSDLGCIQYRGSKHSLSIYSQAVSTHTPQPLVYRGIAYTESH